MNNEEFNDKNIGRIVVALDDSGNFEEALENTTESMISLAGFLWERPDIFQKIVNSEIVLSITYMSQTTEVTADTVTDIDMHKIVPIIVKELTSEELNYEKALTKLDEYVHNKLEENNPDGIQNFIRIFLNQVLLSLINDQEEEETEPFEDSTVFKEFIDSLDAKDQPV
tara:strand:- start:1129 stop:1635 length:507 start_codon:yes stop_codon:yes gene_type:complete